MPFRELDLLIEESQHRSIAEIFAASGEAAFRLAETTQLATLLPGQDQVIATGGGIVVAPENRRRLSTQTFCIFLDPPVEELYRRVKADAAVRPLARGGKKAFISRWEERYAWYVDTAHAILPGSDDPGRLVDSIAGILAGSSKEQTRNER